MCDDNANDDGNDGNNVIRISTSQFLHIKFWSTMHRGEMLPALWAHYSKTIISF